MLVDDVLRELPTPYPADVVELVCMAIEQNEAFMQRYNDLVAFFSQRSQYGKDIVNNWIGKYTSKRAVKQVPATWTTLISSYSMLK